MVAMLRGFRLPDGIFSHYPVTSFLLDTHHFTPSVLLCLDDDGLNHPIIQFFKACLMRKGGNGERNCILSPMLAPNAMLRLLPPTRIMVAEIDCLRDQSYEMALRLLKLQVPCHLILMKDFVHGFH